MTVNETSHPTASAPEIDASCRVPILALVVGASAWLVIGTLLALIASIKFHQPAFLADCAMLTYGRVIAAANDALVYGFCIPAALAVMLWIFSRLSQTVFALPVVPVVAAHIWHLGVLVGLLNVLAGQSSGFNWLEFSRYSSVLLFVAFMLIAVSIIATFGYRLERALYPSHWFLLAALIWFPWIYASGNIFLVAMPVRGVAQAVIDLWYGNNLLYVWSSLVGLGVAFYFIPKLTGSPLRTYFYALFVFWTLLLIGTWCGIPAGSPFPAWIASVSSWAEWLLILPILGVVIVFTRTLGWGIKTEGWGGPLTFIKWGVISFMVASFLVHAATSVLGKSLFPEFTWIGQAETQLEIFGLLGMTLFGALYFILPLVMGYKTKMVGVHCGLNLLGVVLLVAPLIYAGYAQGTHEYKLEAAMPGLMASSSGLLLILAGNLVFALNVLTMFLTWKLALAKSIFAAVTAPLEESEAKS